MTIYGGEEPVTERILHAYFTKPSNGGGTISSIHYPVFGEAAVIIFEDEHSKTKHMFINANTVNHALCWI